MAENPDPHERTLNIEVYSEDPDAPTFRKTFGISLGVMIGVSALLGASIGPEAIQSTVEYLHSNEIIPIAQEIRELANRIPEIQNTVIKGIWGSAPFLMISIPLSLLDTLVALPVQKSLYRLEIIRRDEWMRARNRQRKAIEALSGKGK